MTTTHTFQGLNTDGKPSSRVLNPPGGSSSNIFGGYDDQPLQKTPVRQNPDNVNRSSSDVFGQGQNTAAGPQQKTRAPRSGDDSFHTLFGNCRTSEGSDKASSNMRVSSPSNGVFSQKIDVPLRSYSRIHRDSPDTFNSIFGSERVEHRKIFRSILNNSDDSFTRLFGHSNTNLPKETTSYASTMNVSTIKSTGTSGSSKVSTAMSMEDKMGDRDVRAESFFQVLGGTNTPVKRQSRQRRYSDRGAFNPITGEAYDQPKPKQAPPAPVNSAYEQNSSKTDGVSSASYDTSRSQSSSEQQILQSAEEEKSAPIEQDEPPKPLEPENPKPLEQEHPEPPPQTTVNAQAAHNKKQMQQGHFGADDAEKHPSTRVSQPPGGRSTNLW